MPTKDKLNELFWVHLFIFVVWVGLCNLTDYLDKQDWIISGDIIILFLVSIVIKNAIYKR